jgi:hypothetical protein
MRRSLFRGSALCGYCRYEAQVADTHYFPLYASRFATYAKVKSPEYFAIRPSANLKTEDRYLTEW